MKCKTNPWARKTNPWAWMHGAAAIGAAGVVAACLVLSGCGKQSGVIEASGTVEATSVQVSSQSAGEILRIEVTEGREVARGDLLAEIDHAGLDLQLGQALSGVELAQAQLNLLTSGARGEDLAQAQEVLNQANESLRTAQVDFQRTSSLFKANAATPKERDDAEARVTTARAQAAAAEQALKKLQNFARPEDLAAGLARVNQARYAVRILQKSIQDCLVRSPASGIVTEKLAEVGELASPGAGLFVIANLSTVRLTIYIPETDLGRVRLGERARIRIDSYPKKDFAGTVTWISPVAEFTPRDVQTRDERVKLVFAVRIEIANPDGIFKPGMPADAILAAEGSG